MVTSYLVVSSVISVTYDLHQILTRVRGRSLFDCLSIRQIRGEVHEARLRDRRHAQQLHLLRFPPLERPPAARPARPSRTHFRPNDHESSCTVVHAQACIEAHVTAALSPARGSVPAGRIWSKFPDSHWASTLSNDIVCETPHLRKVRILEHVKGQAWKLQNNKTTTV